MPEKYGPALPPEQPEEEVADPLPTHETACLQGHDGPILAVRFNRTGTYCLTCGKVVQDSYSHCKSMLISTCVVL